jgi:hypothetical protein
MAVPSQKPQPLQIEIPATMVGVYANLARVAHGPAEFVLDFARILPGDGKAMVASRVIMAPVAFKLLVNALNENLARYETTFGTINLPVGGTSLADSLFKPPHPPEPPREPPQDPTK